MTQDFKITRNADGGITIELNGQKAVLDAKAWVQAQASAAFHGAQDRVLYLLEAIHSGEKTVTEHLHLLADRFIHAGHDVAAAVATVKKDLAPIPAAPKAPVVAPPPAAPKTEPTPQVPSASPTAATRAPDAEPKGDDKPADADPGAPADDSSTQQQG
jgi:hypothetical protein